MKIIHIIPGTGGTFYCQNCLRDVSLIRALRALGHDVMVVPMYLPVLLDDRDVTDGEPIFFGGINVYLQQAMGLFRHTPRWMDWLLDRRWVLRKAAKREGSTDAASLGPMTLSMLRGRDGRQRKELDRLVTWLKEQERPDVVHISNSLLIGLAGEVKRALGVPVVCSLQDEDTWLDAMSAADSQACWNEMAAHAADVDAFVSVSEWYAGQMRERMGVPDEKLHRVRIGLDLTGREAAPLDFDPPVIGYLSRLGEKLGLGALVEAFIELKQRPGLERLQLKATGGITAVDRPFVARLRARLEAAGMADDADFIEEFDTEHRKAFLSKLSVLSVPVAAGEAFGTYIVEALAAGVPVVQPKAGAFPELIEATGGGVLFDPNDPAALVAALADLLTNPEHARALGAKGREAVRAQFGSEHMAVRMLEVYAAVGAS